MGSPAALLPEHHRQVIGCITAGGVIEEVVGGRNSVAMELVERAVEIVRAGLGNQRNLRAGGATLIGVRVRRNDAKLLQRIGRGAQDAGECFVRHYVKPALLLVIVNAVEQDVGLIGAPAIDITGAGHARLQTEQADRISGVERQFLDAAVIKGIADGRVRRVERRVRFRT